MDYVARGTTRGGRIRIFFADVTETAAEICRRHQTTAVAADALSRLVAVGAIMGKMQKYGKVNLRIESNGPLKILLVQASDSGHVRGYVAHPEAEVPLRADGSRDVGAAIGTLGILTVIKELAMKQDFASQVALQTGEIGDDFSYYFYTSEQIPSVVAVGCTIRADGTVALAGAFLAQLMPGSQEEDIAYAERLAAALPPIPKWITAGGVEVLTQYDPEFQWLETAPIEFHCNCSREHFMQSMAVLKQTELAEMVAANQSQDVQCNFCGATYELTPTDLAEILRRQTQTDELS